MDEKVVTQYVKLGEYWLTDLECLFSYMSPRFGRIDRQRHAWEYLLGLLSTVERKSGWQLAEAAEHTSPNSLQHLLDRAPWDANAVRDDLMEYIVGELGDRNGVLVVDETGFLKKAPIQWECTGSTAVQQYSWPYSELPDWRVPGVCKLARAHIDGSRIVFAAGMDR